MSLRELVEQLDGRNLAEKMDEDTLKELGDEVVRRFEEDQDSMFDWMEAVDKGYELVKQEFHPKTEPFEGASNYKSTQLQEACISFGDRATTSILKAGDLVKGEAIGKDPQREKAKRIDRVCEMMNYQLNHQMPEWREHQSGLFYQLAMAGCLFKRVSFDPMTQRNKSSLISYPNFVVNMATKSLDTCRSFTHILAMGRNEVIERQRAKVWVDVDLWEDEGSEDNPVPADRGSNEAEGVDRSEDNEERFFEQFCYADLDEDGYAEPYIVTVHENTNTVMRIVPRYTEKSIVVRDQRGAINTLPEAMQAQAEMQMQMGNPQPVLELNELKLVRIEPDDGLIKYEFLPNPEGLFLGIGYSHLMVSNIKSINSTTNMLMDSGQLSNLQGGWLSKEFRKKMGKEKTPLGKFIVTEVPAEALSKGVQLFPTKEPSATLFQLNEKITAETKQLSANISTEGLVQANTAPTTALAVIQEAMLPLSALLMRVVWAMSKEFKELFKLNAKYLDPRLYQMVTDDPQANYEQDFQSEMMDIMPTANPEMSSKTQRIQQAMAGIEQLPVMVQAGGNPLPIVKDYFEAIGYDDSIERIFPPEGALTPQEQQQIQAMTQAQQQANQLQAMQLQLLDRQIKTQELEAETLAMRRQYEMADLQAGTQAKIAGIEKTRAEVVSVYKQAELQEKQAELKEAETMETIKMMPADRKLKIAQAVKAMAEAEAQDIENQAVESGVDALAKKVLKESANAQD